jgi:hypothetical protein
MNEGPSLTETIIIIVIITSVLVVFFWSWVRILHRMGLSGWWVLTMGLWPIMLPILATCRWPAVDGKRKAETAN